MTINHKTLKLLAILGLTAAVAMTGACSGKRSNLMSDQPDTRSVAPMSDETNKAEVCMDNPEHPSCEMDESMDEGQEKM